MHQPLFQCPEVVDGWWLPYCTAQRKSTSILVETSMGQCCCVSGKTPGLGWVLRGQKNELGDSSCVCRPGAPGVPASPPGHASSPIPLNLLSLLRLCPRGPPYPGEVTPCSVATSAFSPFPDSGSVSNLGIGGGVRGGVPHAGSAGGMAARTHRLWLPRQWPPMSVQLIFLFSVLSQTLSD